ncbi:hypothetical protein EV360DRAFT_84189 [Lentinula raphanica]|nr:hypothetical protein EV360DRAFT_84189 [Lentinula raphanica]
MADQTSPVFSATSISPHKRKLDAITRYDAGHSHQSSIAYHMMLASLLSSDVESGTPSPLPSRRRPVPPFSCKSSSNHVKASQKAHRTTIMKEVTMIQKLKTPSKLKNNDIVTQPIHRASNQMSNISGPEAPLGHRNTLTSRLVSSYPCPKTPVARHMRVLSRHIRSFEIPVDAQGTQANFSLTQIPSIMDVYLDAKSPSIDFTEEVLLEIAARSRRLSLISSPGFALASSTPQSLCPHRDVCDARHSANSDSQLSSLTSEMTGLNPPWGQISLGKNAAQSGSLARHPDSFERSTATWSEGLNGK